MDDYKIIKKYYGEAFAKYCRKTFPTILEEKGLLARTLLKHYHPSSFLYEDILEQ